MSYILYDYKWNIYYHGLNLQDVVSSIRYVKLDIERRTVLLDNKEVLWYTTEWKIHELPEEMAQDIIRYLEKNSRCILYKSVDN